MNNLTSGQRLQLNGEFESAKNQKNAQWDVIAYHNGVPVHEFERRIPRWLSLIFIRNLVAWYILFKLHKKYDYLI